VILPPPLHCRSTDAFIDYDYVYDVAYYHRLDYSDCRYRIMILILPFTYRLRCVSWFAYRYLPVALTFYVCSHFAFVVCHYYAFVLRCWITLLLPGCLPATRVDT